MSPKLREDGHDPVCAPARKSASPRRAPIGRLEVVISRLIHKAAGL